MAPVRVKYIVSFSCQDDCHKASNLVTNDGSKYWLSNRKNSSGQTEIVLQLEEPTQLAYLDIGTVWCAHLEIRVGRSDWHQTTEFKPLLPTVMLMSPLDCRLNRSVKTTQMFSMKDFSQEVSSKHWDRLHIICRQPYRKDVQFGISFIHIKNVNPSSSVVQGDSSTGQAGKSMLDASSIQKHFFGEAAKHGDGSPTDMLKYKLMKMAGSTENGCDQAQALSRTAKLVLKASENSGPYSPRHISSPLPKKGLFSEHLAKKNDVPIDKEIQTFLPTLNISAADIDKVTIADLRHKFERGKRRKLTKEEKVIFLERCQDFICDLFDKNNICLETEKFGCVLEAKIQDPPVTEKKSGSLSNGFISPWSASELKKTPRRKMESQLKKTCQTRKADSRNLSSPADVNFSSVSESSLLDVSLNKDDSMCSASETPAKYKHLSELPFSKNNSTASLCNMIPEVSSPAALAVILNEKNISYEAVKKRRKCNQDKEEEQNLVCDNQDLLLVTTHSLQRNRKSFCREKHEISNQENNCEGITTTNEDVISSNSYDREIHSNNEGLYPETFQSPGNKVIAVENLNKSCRKLYSPINSSQNPATPNSAAVSFRKSAKLKQLNKASFDLFQEFSMEIMNNEDGPESIANIDETKTHFSTSKQELFQSEDSNIASPSLDNCSTKDIKNVICSTKSTPEKSGLKINEAVLKDKTPRSAKGKIYRMYASRNKLKPAGHTEANQDLDNLVSNLSSHNCGAQKDFSNEVGTSVVSGGKPLIDVGDNCTEGEHLTLSESVDLKKKTSETLKQMRDIAMPTLLGGTSRAHGKKQSNMNQTVSVPSNNLNDGFGHTSGGRHKKQKKQINRQRTQSVPATMPDTAFCDKCHDGAVIIPENINIGDEIQFWYVSTRHHPDASSLLFYLSVTDSIAGMYPLDTIQTHRAFCIPPPSQYLGLAFPPELSWAGSVHEMLIDDMVDYAECPICLQRFSQDILLVHASVCGGDCIVQFWQQISCHRFSMVRAGNVCGGCHVCLKLAPYLDLSGQESEVDELRNFSSLKSKATASDNKSKATASDNQASETWTVYSRCETWTVYSRHVRKLSLSYELPSPIAQNKVAG